MGSGRVSFVEHEDKPFRVSGILAKTGTPVDRTVLVSLEAIEAIHVDWQSGGRIPGQTISADDVRKMDLKPKAITAALIGLKSKARHVQAAAGNQRVSWPSRCRRSCQAWRCRSCGALSARRKRRWRSVSAMVVLTALLGMVTMILTTLNERRREMAILRSVGARPATILGMLVAEVGRCSPSRASCAGTALLYAALFVLRPWIDSTYGLHLTINPLKPSRDG